MASNLAKLALPETPISALDVPHRKYIMGLFMPSSHTFQNITARLTGVALTTCQIFGLSSTRA
jgi:hypothetical protein